MIDKLTIINSNGDILSIIDDNSRFLFEDIESNYHEITAKLIEKSLTITTMESCTSGLIASLITDCEGASAAFKGGFVTYSNEAKILNGVPKEIVEKYGVYSFETAKAMAKTCKGFYSADIGIGITGTLGNTDPQNDDSVKGEVFIGICVDEQSFLYKAEITGIATRNEWKLAVAKAVAIALFMLF